MELILVDDVRRQIAELGKLIRIADPGAHALLTAGSVREVDFSFSADMQWIEADLSRGLSFATNMQKFKGIVKNKARFVASIDIYALEETRVHIEGLRFVHDRPGHVSLAVTRRMRVGELIAKLELLRDKLEPIGTLRVAP